MSNESIEIGTKVTRIDTGFVGANGTPGTVIEVSDDRVRIAWDSYFGSKPRKSWQQRKAQGKRWQLA